MRTKRFDRTQRDGWLLAESLRCPSCGAVLWGDKEYAWCKSFDCDYSVSWARLEIECYVYRNSQRLWGFNETLKFDESDRKLLELRIMQNQKEYRSGKGCNASDCPLLR